jgi:hypothetical protein
MVDRALGAIRRHFARYGEWWWVPILYTLAVLWIYRDQFHQNGRAVGFGWDAIDSYGPDLELQSHELADGRFPLWNPWDKGGYPLISDPQFDRYYPFNWPFVVWGAVFGSSWWLIQIKVLAHHVVAACAMHLFLRSRGLSVRAAIVGGFGLVASTPLLVHKASNIVWPMVWVPIVWLAIDRALDRPSWRRGAALAAAFTLCVTAGSPPGLFYSGLLVLPYGAWRLALVLRDPVRRTRDAVIRLAICGATAGLLAGTAIALVTVTAQPLVELGSRWRWARPEEFPFALSQAWGAVMRAVVARGAGFGEFYMGSAIVLLAACAVVLRPRFDRGVPVVFVAWAMLAIVLACGDTTPVLPLVVKYLPGFDLLRIPNRYKLVAVWALVAAAGYGVAALEQATGRARLRVIAVAAVGVALAAVFVEMWPQPPSHGARDEWWSIVAMAIAAVGVVAVALAPARWRAPVISALAIGTLLDAPWFHHTPHGPPVADPRRLHERDDELLRQLDGVRDRWRLYDEFILGERVGTRARVRDFRGYPSVDPLSQNRYATVLEFARKQPGILPEFNVKWVLPGVHFRHGTQFEFAKMPDSHFTPNGMIYIAKDPAPLVMWYGAVTVAKSKVLDAMLATGRTRAVMEPPDFAHVPAWLADAPDAAAPGEVVRYEPDEIAIAVDAPRNGIVVLNELVFPGWEVEIDGEPATPLRANYLLRAVYVTAGHHEITWTFRPPGFRLLLDGYLAALVVMAIALRKRRRSPAGSS